MMRIAVIGGGISGLAIANLLKDTNDVVVFEKEAEPGGLIKCQRIKDCLFHRVGGHVFNSTNSEVLNWFWSYFDKESEFVKAKRNAKVYFNKEILGYPIENNIYSFDKALVRKIISELLELNSISPEKSPVNTNFGDFLRNNFGETLYELYFKPYNEKIWKTDLSTISLEWLEGKLPMPNLKQILEKNILREEDVSMVHSTFYYPKYGGSQFIVDKLRHGLDIRTGTSIKDIHANGSRMSVGSGGDFDAIIYTGNVKELPAMVKDLIDEEPVELSHLKELRSNGTSNLFCETDENDISWLYLPESFTKAHRIIYTGNFSETNNRGSLRKTCVVEFAGHIDYKTMCTEIKMLPGNLTPLSHNHEPNSYVIQDQGTRKTISAFKKVLDKHNIFLLGRFAEWEYYNMDKAIEAAFSLKSRINN